jgi:hypothetical protein
MLHPGQANEQGEILLFDKWANEGNRRIRVWRLPHDEIRIEFVDAGQPGEPAYAMLTLADYRAGALARSLLPGPPDLLTPARLSDHDPMQPLNPRKPGGFV